MTKQNVSQGKPPAVSFLRLQPILEILQSCIWTSRVAGEKPVSVILIAEQESAKTQCLKYFQGTSTLIYLADITSKGLTPYRSDIERGRIRHFCIMDLVRVVNHGKGVSNRTIQTLSSFIEEGEADSSDGGGITKWDKFPVIGCLTAITPAYFKMKKGGWRDTGFLSRFLPVRFTYSAETVHEIHSAIAQDHKLPEPQKEVLPEHDCFVNIRPEHAKAIQRKAEELGQMNQTYGFRYHRALRSLAKGRALRRRDGFVNDSDIAKVLEWSSFFGEKEIIL